MPGRSIGWDLHTPDDPADEPSHWQRYGFDGAGRLNAVSSPAGEYSYTYVEQSHLLASVSGPVHTVTNSYESGRDVMTSKSNAAASGTVSRFGAKYDALGRRIETSRSGSAFAQNFVSDYQYDLLGQLTKDERFAGETPGDPAAKLEAQSFGFLFDGIGNRLTAQKGNDTTAYTPNALNQYTDIDGIEPVYDADGNLFSDGKNRFHWDAENRLTLVEPLVPTEGSKRLEFKYDYIGRRVSKQVWTHTGGSWTDESTTAFVYDGWNLIEEVSTSSQTASINHYTWGLDLSLSLQGAGGVGGLLSVVCAPFTESGLIGDWLLPIGYVPPALSGVEGPALSPAEGEAPSTFHYTFDLNGNVSEVLDSTGSIAAHYEYGPFDEMLRETYPSSALSEVERSLLTFNFSTKYHDSETGLLYYGYRYYDPSNGRWLNRDPIEESGGVNLYGFVGNDGVNRWDLWGNDYGPPLFPYYEYHREERCPPPLRIGFVDSNNSTGLGAANDKDFKILIDIDKRNGKLDMYKVVSSFDEIPLILEELSKSYDIVLVATYGHGSPDGTIEFGWNYWPKPDEYQKIAKHLAEDGEIRLNHCYSARQPVSVPTDDGSPRAFPQSYSWQVSVATGRPVTGYVNDGETGWGWWFVDLLTPPFHFYGVDVHRWALRGKTERVHFRDNT